jgi:hypothetical protein
MKILLSVFCLFLSGHVSALEGVYERLSGDIVVSFSSSGDWTREQREGEKEWIDQGVYEEVACWNQSAGESSTQGGHIFYKSDGAKCCMRVREVGSKFLMERIVGSQIGLCGGGVFQRRDD